jgi:uncharacterized protein YutE (UPF0331/DUF86 family)
VETGVVDEERGRLFREMAGHRKRLVHFHVQVGSRELCQICTERLDDVETVLEAILAWIGADPERVDDSV